MSECQQIVYLIVERDYLKFKTSVYITHLLAPLLLPLYVNPQENNSKLIGYGQVVVYLDIITI